MTINASLFAHIVNDAELTGVYGLEGQHFANTTTYLQNYLDSLVKNKVTFPPAYQTILNELQYLVKIETKLLISSTHQDIATLADEIIDDVSKILGTQRRRVLIPGGYSARPHGHAMIYQITRSYDRLIFTVYNSGAGLHYHAKQSTPEKEVYNPTKVWSAPLPNDSSESLEWKNFIQRLLIAQKTSLQDNHFGPMSAKKLYEEILESISYVNAKETDANIDFPSHAYTGGQLSGTCAQRVLHQMIKINSIGERAYQRFIFDFKQYALHDYVTACIEGREPFNAGVRSQIELGINNNLKILNTPELFSDKKVKATFNAISALRASLPLLKDPLLQNVVTPITSQRDLHIQPLKRFSSFSPSTHAANNLACNIPINVNLNDLMRGHHLIDNLQSMLNHVITCKTSAQKLMFIETTIMAMPLSTSIEPDTFSLPFYNEIRTLSDFNSLDSILESFQSELLQIHQNGCLTNIQTPSWQIMILSLVNLQAEIYDQLTARQSLPSFHSFTAMMMKALTAHLERNPYLATNKPALDKRLYGLIQRYKDTPTASFSAFHQYLQGLLETDPGHRQQLIRLYHTIHGQDTSTLHVAIRAAQLDDLYMIYLHHIHTHQLPTRFNDLINKIDKHFAFEARIRQAINPFYVNQFAAHNAWFRLSIDHESFRVSSPLFPVFLPFEDFTTVLEKHKYNIAPSPARDALVCEILKKSTYVSFVYYPRSENHIQLYPSGTIDQTDQAKRITANDIIARDYFYLRHNPKFQIALTLDYFTRHIKSLAEEPNQRYVEANLFQPLQLFKALDNDQFLIQFDGFIETGLRYFAHEGQHTHETLIFIRLEFLMSRYIYLADSSNRSRLRTLQEKLVKHLMLRNSPSITWFLQQYLFLTIMAQINLASINELQIVEETETLNLALTAYFYIQKNTNPHILEDDSHRSDVECNIAKFQCLLSTLPDALIKQHLKSIDFSSSSDFFDHELRGVFPHYYIRPLSKLAAVREVQGETERRTGVDTLVHEDLSTVSTQQFSTAVGFREWSIGNWANSITIDVLQGRCYINELAQSHLPLAIQNHPLFCSLALTENTECLMSNDETIMILQSADKNDVYLRYRNGNLTIEKNWTINNQTQRYRLIPLTKHHLAHHENNQAQDTNYHNLPKILKDGDMNYWDRTDTYTNSGILVQQNTPIYEFNEEFYPLDSNHCTTTHHLTNQSQNNFSAFEDIDFQIVSMGQTQMEVKLPRYDLTFVLDTTQSHKTYTCLETDETVLAYSTPIHPKVAGVTLLHHKQKRILVPIQRFYATEKNAHISEIYPVVHDIHGHIAEEALKNKWQVSPPPKEPLWHYTASEKTAQFKLNDDLTPIADTPADALYLTYIYLATHQTQKAWTQLEDCYSRLGGLTGNIAELQYINWIYNDLPHCLPQDQESLAHAKHKTYPYIANQLKAIYLLCDYLAQDRQFQLQPPHHTHQTANTIYEMLQYEQMKTFLQTLPQTVYTLFSRIQLMQRHNNSAFNLSKIERKYLLNYYHESSQSELPCWGALGHEWMRLSLESLEAERTNLCAKINTDGDKTPISYQHRLQTIEHHFKNLKPIVARSTAIEYVDISLTLPKDATIQTSFLNPQAQADLDKWASKLPGAAWSESMMIQAMQQLQSNISESDLITYFPAFLQAAISNDKQAVANLLKFSIKTLIATRHLPLNNQSSNKSLIFNVLYRVLSQPVIFKDIVTYRPNGMSFKEIVEITSDYVVADIKVPQAKDVYSDILASPVGLRSTISFNSHRPLTTRATHQTDLINLLKSDQGDSGLNKQQIHSLNQLMEKFHHIKSEYTLTLNTLREHFKPENQNAFDIELTAGEALLAFEKKQQALANESLTQPTLFTNMLIIARKLMPPILAKNIALWDNAIALANQGPCDPSIAQRWDIEIAAQSRRMNTKTDLYSMYTQANLVDSMSRTGLSAKDVQKLHDIIHQAIIGGIQAQALSRMIQAFDNALNTPKLNNALPAFQVLTESTIQGTEEPTIMLLQHEAQIILKDRQVSALQSLLQINDDPNKRFHETIEKIPMGGGKTKYILPILAEKKALGDNLVVIEVPQALLATNHVDLNRTSQRVFGKRAYRFEFSRDSNCSPARLKKMYYHLTEIMTSRTYLVTTGESIQSLELKYIELLLSKQNDSQSQQQLTWLDQLTKLFRYHADCIIDEVHQGLWVKKKLNYTVGEPLPISTEMINNATALFSFIDIDFIKQAPALPSDYDWSDFIYKLAEKLITHSNSPLRSFVEQCKLYCNYAPTTLVIPPPSEGGESDLLHNTPMQASGKPSSQTHRDEIERILIEYLTDQAELDSSIGANISKEIVFQKQIPAIVMNASEEDKQNLAFFKEQITRILPQTLSRRLNLHYGASKRDQLSPFERTLAIPYSANNIPNEQSRFGNVIEAINFTIQMMLLTGIHQDLLIEQIKEWQGIARQELFQNLSITELNQTPTALGFAIQYSHLNITLGQININNATQISSLHEKLQHDFSLILSCLKTHTLKQITHDQAILHSDTFNHVGLYRSVQGISGTPSNVTTFAHRLQYDPKISLGSDGYVLKLIDDKNTTISYHNYQNVYEFINDTLSQSTSEGRTRAIIDINATLEGVSNEHVALELIRFIKTNPTYFNQTIKHILYFNEQQVLCAISIKESTKTIRLATSDAQELDRLLNSTPDERFTYYDQAHTTGTDIKQAPWAHAIVLVDNKIALQSYLQGCMRMREFGQEQTIELIAPKQLSHLSRHEITLQIKENEKQLQLRDTLIAAIGQMNNLIRLDCLRRIEFFPPAETTKKRQLADQYRVFFESYPCTDLFKLYGNIQSTRPAENILSRCRETILTQWKNVMQLNALALSTDEEVSMRDHFQAVIDKTLPNCVSEALDNYDNLEAEVEVQKEIYHEVEIEQLLLEESYNQSRRERRPTSWNSKDIYEAIFLKYIAKPLNEIASSPAKTIQFFSNNLMVSINQAFAFMEQPEAISAFLKPCFLIWYHVKKDGQLAAMIVSNWEGNFDHLSENNSWLSTTDDTLLIGNRDLAILDTPEYQTLREQIHFFNGQIESLLNQQKPLIWLKEQPEAKLDFFEKRLLPYRPRCASAIQQLKTTLLQVKHEGFIYIAKHPYENYHQFAWNKLYPNILPIQLNEYQKVANVFMWLNQHFIDTESLDMQIIQAEFKLTVQQLVYVSNHLQNLLTLKQLLNALNQAKLSHQPLLYGVIGNKTLRLASIMKMSDADLCQLFNLDPTHLPLSAEDPDYVSWESADIHLLMILDNHPAISAGQLIDDYLAAIARKTISKFTLQRLLKFERWPNNLLMNIIQNKLFDNELFSIIIEQPEKYPADENIWCALAYHAQTEDHIAQIIHHVDFLTPTILKRIIQIPHLSLNNIKEILNIDNELMNGELYTLLIQIVIQHLHENDLGPTNLIWEQILVELLSRTLLIQSTEVFNERFQSLHLTRERESKFLYQLSIRAETTSTINTLLNHPSMTSQLADGLFNKAAYKGHVEHWHWMTKEQLSIGLDRCETFTDLQKCITHPIASNSCLNDWLSEIRHECKISMKLAKMSNNPHTKILATLDKLKIKACQHALKSLHDLKYLVVAKTAYDLYQQLRDQVEDYYANEPQYDKGFFLPRCTALIENARPTLEQHRGYKDILFTILNVILNAITFRFKDMTARHRFFLTAKTNSIGIVENIYETINENVVGA